MARCFRSRRTPDDGMSVEVAGLHNRFGFLISATGPPVIYETIWWVDSVSKGSVEKVCRWTISMLIAGG